MAHTSNSLAEEMSIPKEITRIEYVRCMASIGALSSLGCEGSHLEDLDGEHEKPYGHNEIYMDFELMLNNQALRHSHARRVER